MEFVGDIVVKFSYVEVFVVFMEFGNGDLGYILMCCLLFYRKVFFNKFVWQKWELNGNGYVVFYDYIC